MPHIRTIKPQLFQHFDLYETEQRTGLPVTLTFIALFCVADRQGRFRWRPNELKLHCLPYHDLKFADVLEALRKAGFIHRYDDNGDSFGVIPNFLKHQRPNVRESQSDLPAPPAGHPCRTCNEYSCTCTHVQAPARTWGIRNKEGNKEGNKEVTFTSSSKNSEKRILRLSPAKNASNGKPDKIRLSAASRTRQGKA